MYLWLKAFHIIAVISWMAGLLYLPRLFVYHCEAEPGSKQSETFKVMERRLLSYIMLPAMIVSWVLGIVLMLTGRPDDGSLVHRQVRRRAGAVGGTWVARRAGRAISASTATGTAEILSYRQ